jgi:PAS domain S-box-containing protein
MIGLMQVQGATPGVRYSAAVALSAVAVGLRAILGPALAGTPYVTAYLSVLVAAPLLGLGPSLLVIAAGGLGCSLLPPGTDLTRLLIFVITSLLVTWIVEVLRRARSEAERHAHLADERLKQLELEAAQRAKEERLTTRLRALVESSDDAIISRTLDGAIESWNRGAEQVFGYSAAEAIGQPSSFLAPPDRLHEEDELIERIRHGGRVKHFETIRRRKDGRLIHVSISASPIRDGEGAIIGASKIARDITERKEFEEQIRQTQKLESLGVLAGGLAHDFNNLLTGIMGNASLAAGEMETNPARACERLDEVLLASERAALLIRQMLAYAGKGRFMIEKLDLSTQVREILPLLGASVPKFVEVQLRLDDTLPSVEADRSQIQQLIMNLAINAAEAMGERPGTVTITTSHRAENGERQVVLEVSDTGDGMTDEVKARIFDPFFTTKFTGRGLGLSAVMGIIRAHHGAISVTSAPGEGATVTVVLPAAAEAAGAASKAETETDLRGYGLVLVADDEELVRNMARFTLERFGYSVETACDGREALEKFEARRSDFAAVLLDLTMPVLHGEDVLRAIRGSRRDVPVVLSSGYTEAEALARFDNLLPAGFLQKPYTATALARKIKSAVRQTHSFG